MNDMEPGGARSEPRSTKRLVVGLGASAGGIEALREFFAYVPPRSGAAYVVILHLSPDHDSRLAEVLQTSSSIPVTQVRQSVAIEPDHVYVVPPNARLEIRNATLTPMEFTQPEHRRSSVDLFFRALADAYGSSSVAVVLSGTGPDGSTGLKRIKEHGGLVIAQTPDQAAFGDMPNNAIATRMVDLVLRVEEIPRRIAEYHARLQQLETGTAVIELADEPDALREILALLRARTGHDFANYKSGTLMRRLQRRLNVVGLTTLSAYARLIREQPQEARLLMKDLLISVTHFFRDPEAFGVLEQRVIPRLFDNKAADDQIRVWVAGCATGEEAYSVAMLVAEHGGGLLETPQVQIFATDLDEDAIGTARDGLYTDADVVDLAKSRLSRFFYRDANGYRVRRELREMMLFAHHNLIRDPPFSHLDLISCRNVLIYLNRDAQDRVMETFHFALRPSGLLMLGPSEAPEGAADLFAPFDRTAHLYESRSATSRPLPSERLKQMPAPPLIRPPESRGVERFAPLDAHHRLLEEYAPPSLIVTEDNTIVHMSKGAARYLQVPAGEPSRDLLRLARPELRVELHTALFEAAKTRTAVEITNLPVSVDGSQCRVNLMVRPVLREDDPARGFFLVLFAEAHDASSGAHDVRRLETTPEPLARHLDEELSRVKAQLRTTIEQYEAQVEEAQSAAEEHQAMNEELRSSAEELETGKEEIQSVNEELTTVNQELKLKIEELRLRNDDFQNLINSTDIATLFLDRSLRLKTTTPRAQDIFNLLRTDVGRPLSDITSRLAHSGLEHDLRLVLDQLKPIDREVLTTDGRWFLMRIRPYRTTDDRIDGVVLMFQDITDRRDAERSVARSEERLRLLIDRVVDYAIFTIGDDGAIDSWNTGAQRMYGYRADEIIGRPFAMLFTQDDREVGLPADELAGARRDGRATGERFHVRADGTVFYGSGVITTLGNESGLGFAKIVRDLTAQQRAAEAVRDAHALLDRHAAERTQEIETVLADHQAARAHFVNLLRKVVTAQEDERSRIARNLHDQLGQRMTALRLILERAQTVVEKGDCQDELTRALELTNTIDADVGFLSWELRPAVLDHFGLAVALPRYAREWSQHYGIEVAYRGDSFGSERLSHEAEVALYRIAQEALTNVAKHAHASRVDVLLETRDRSVVLVVEDDGVGFDPADREVGELGTGLLSMRERAALIGGEFQVESKPGDGTSIFARYPMAVVEGTPS